MAGPHDGDAVLAGIEAEAVQLGLVEDVGERQRGDALGSAQGFGTGACGENDERGCNGRLVWAAATTLWTQGQIPHGRRVGLGKA